MVIDFVSGNDRKVWHNRTIAKNQPRRSFVASAMKLSFELM